MSLVRTAYGPTKKKKKSQMERSKLEQKSEVLVPESRADNVPVS